jgi:hypothetical protein
MEIRQGLIRDYIPTSYLAENNSWCNKVLQARHDRLLDYVYSFWAYFNRYQNMVDLRELKEMAEDLLKHPVLKARYGEI